MYFSCINACWLFSKSRRRVFTFGDEKQFSGFLRIWRTFLLYQESFVEGLILWTVVACFTFSGHVLYIAKERIFLSEKGGLYARLEEAAPWRYLTIPIISKQNSCFRKNCSLCYTENWLTDRNSLLYSKKEIKKHDMSPCKAMLWNDHTLGQMTLFFLPDLKRGCPTTIVIGNIHHICTYYKHQ